MTYILYGLCIVLTLVSFLKNKEKTKKAVINGVKSFEKIMPQFLSIVIVIAITLTILKPETISKLILNKVFAGNANLKPISGKYWKNNCCIRKSNECILSIIDVEKIQKEEKIKSSNSLYKLQVLMANTIYLSVLKEIDRIIGENISDSLAGKLSDLYKTNVYNAEKNKLS